MRGAASRPPPCARGEGGSRRGGAGGVAERRQLRPDKGLGRVELKVVPLAVLVELEEGGLREARPELKVQLVQPERRPGVLDRVVKLALQEIKTCVNNKNRGESILFLLFNVLD